MKKKHRIKIEREKKKKEESWCGKKPFKQKEIRPAKTGEENVIHKESEGKK